MESINLDPPKIIFSIIRAFDLSKAHGWDNVSVRMVNICDESFFKPLFNIFQFSLETGNFPRNWKRGNIVPVHKKGYKNFINSYQPVCLIPIFSKIYEKCIYDTPYNYFQRNNLFNSRSDFRKGDSCVSQLLSITHEKFRGFDANPSLDTCGRFWDISKAFDKVWHEALIFELRSNGISDSLLCLSNSFSSERLQRVGLKSVTWRSSMVTVLFFLWSVIQMKARQNWQRLRMSCSVGASMEGFIQSRSF